MNRDIRDVETENWPELKKHDELTGLITIIFVKY